MRYTVRAALEEATAAIDAVDARVLACHVLAVDRAWLVTHPLHVLTETQSARFDTLVAFRSQGHPVAYLVGTREFYGRDFAVGPEVLIPRPETETLVEAALARLPAAPRILDLGTGSGAIAVTLACERVDAEVHATDTSADALAVARANADRHGARIAFALGRWYDAVAGERFDAIVANPPYVAVADPHLGEGDLRFEPRAALTDGSADGLASLRAIASGAPGHLKPGGWLLVEHGYDQAASCRALLEAAGFSEVVSFPDLAGLARVVAGRWR